MQDVSSNVHSCIPHVFFTALLKFHVWLISHEPQADRIDVPDADLHKHASKVTYEHAENENHFLKTEIVINENKNENKMRKQKTKSLNATRNQVCLDKCTCTCLGHTHAPVLAVSIQRNAIFTVLNH